MRTVPIEDVSPEPVSGVSRPLLSQRWRDVTFVHWRVQPAAVAPYLPAGTVPDTFGGVTYVGLIALRMVGVGPARGPAVPYLGTFCETNVRVYAVDRRGRRSVVFLSMDAERLVPVLAARAALRLPYMWSAMRLTKDGDIVRYLSRRRWPGPPTAVTRMAVQVGAPIPDPTQEEHFLTARWALHTPAWGRTLYLPSEHPRWPLHRARLLELNETLLLSAGLAPPGPPDSVLYSPGVPAVFGPPTPV
jgi:uncharacterized protein YqjF (DUF2071 family)